MGAAGVRVFLDGRADPYPATVWADYVRLATLHPGWRDVLRRRRINAVVAERDGPLDQGLGFEPAWRPAYGDASFRLWITRS